MLNQRSLIEAYQTYYDSQYRNNTETQDYFKGIYNNLMFNIYLFVISNDDLDKNIFSKLITEAIKYYETCEKYEICQELKLKLETSFK